MLLQCRGARDLKVRRNIELRLEKEVEVVSPQPGGEGEGHGLVNHLVLKCLLS